MGIWGVILAIRNFDKVSWISQLFSSFLNIYERMYGSNLRTTPHSRFFPFLWFFETKRNKTEKRKKKTHERDCFIVVGGRSHDRSSIPREMFTCGDIFTIEAGFFGATFGPVGGTRRLRSANCAFVLRCGCVSLGLNSRSLVGLILARQMLNFVLKC